MEEVKVTIKKCDDCGSIMINDCMVDGQLHYEIGAESRSTIRVHVPTGEKTNNLLGMEVDKSITYPIKARYCPNCGKVDLYAVLNK